MCQALCQTPHLGMCPPGRWGCLSQLPTNGLGLAGSGHLPTITPLQSSQARLAFARAGSKSVFPVVSPMYTEDRTF